jgi:hypothetical protein
MPIGGTGPSAIATMWALTGFTAIFVGLRMYTRFFHVQAVGADDYVYNFAFFLLVLYTVFVTVSATHGFGQNMWDIPDPQDIVDAILFEAIGQVCLVVGMALAKWSLGLFLLRIVTVSWHRILIWSFMILLMVGSLSVCFVFMLQCTPPAYLWDRRIPGGYCHLDASPVSLAMCIFCVISDFFFALFPWYFIWRLQMNKREKIIILLSMSLGVIAGACGIWRTLEVPSLSSQNYLRDTVGLVVWSAAEISVTLICISIPVCRPLYKKYLDKLTSNDRSKDRFPTPQGLALRTFGGSTMHRLDEENQNSYDSNMKKRSGVSTSKAFAVSRADDNSSEDGILRPDSNQTPSNGHQTDNGPHIYVKQEYRVTSSS